MHINGMSLSKVPDWQSWPSGNCCLNFYVTPPFTSLPLSCICIQTDLSLPLSWICIQTDPSSLSSVSVSRMTPPLCPVTVSRLTPPCPVPVSRMTPPPSVLYLYPDWPLPPCPGSVSRLTPPLLSCISIQTDPSLPLSWICIQTDPSPSVLYLYPDWPLPLSVLYLYPEWPLSALDLDPEWWPTPS